MARLGRGKPLDPIIVRGSLVDTDVRAAPTQPIVAIAPAPRAQPPYILIAAAPAAPSAPGAPAPVIVQPARTLTPGQATVLRGSLVDLDVRAAPTQPVLAIAGPPRPQPPFVLVTAAPAATASSAPAPTIVQPPRPVPAVVQPTITRGSLVDLDVRAAPTQPVVAIPPAPRPAPPYGYIGSAPQPDASAPAAASPQPYLATPPSPRPPAPYLYVGSAPVVPQPPTQPYMAIADVRRPQRVEPVIVRAPLPPLGAPLPVIVQPAVKPLAQPVIVITSAPQPPVAPPPGGAPAPWVVTFTPPRPTPYLFIGRGAAECHCTTARPDTGTTTHTVLLTARPNTGITPRPCTC